MLKKQDRHGVRSPADLERKYKLGAITEAVKSAAEAKAAVDGLDQEAIINLLTEATKLVPEGVSALLFDDWDALNAFVYEVLPTMNINTQKTFGATVSLEYSDKDLNGYGTLTLCVGLTEEGFPVAMVTLLVYGYHLCCCFYAADADASTYYMEHPGWFAIGGTSSDTSGSSGVSLSDVYPVGSIYMSVNATSPATLFGGTWQRLKDRFLLGAGDTYAAGSTGGEATHTLTAMEMPTHTHSGLYYTTSSGTKTTIALNAGEVAHKLSWSSKSGKDVAEIYTGAAGYSGAHNNMPPYLAVYMWVRTA